MGYVLKAVLSSAQHPEYCHQQNGQSLGETRTALLREQAEEGLEIRL